MEVFKTISEIISIALAIITTLSPIIFRNFKRENQIVKRKTKKGELIDIYGLFLIVPIFSLGFQLSLRTEPGFFKSILVFFSFVLPIEAIIIIGYRAWKFCKQNYLSNTKLKRIEKLKNISAFLINIMIWIIYSTNMIFIVYTSYIITSNSFEHWVEYVGLYIGTYLFSIIMYLIVGKLLIGCYSKEYASKIKINYNYKGEDVEKEISFNHFKVKSEYVSFYIENENVKHFIPWDKVNDIAVYYK